MARRFKSLKYALTTLRTPTGTGTVPDAPAGSILAKYQDYAAGQVQLNYPRSEDSLQKSIKTVKINPFGLAEGATNLVAVGFSERASTALTGNTITAANHTAGSAGDERSKNFIPARAIIRDLPANPPTTEGTSQITGRKYKENGAKSYTLPYGKKAGQLLESEVRSAIGTAAQTTFGENTSITFKSEQL